MSQHKKIPTPPTPPAEKKPSLITTLWHGTCAWYTSISAFVLLFNLLFPANDTGYVRARSFLLFLPFALTLALAGLVRRAEQLSTAARVILHPLCALGGFYLCFYLPYQLDKKPSAGQMLAMLVLAAVVYGAAVGVLALLSRRKKQKQVDDTPYVSQFGRKS